MNGPVFLASLALAFGTALLCHNLGLEPMIDLAAYLDTLN